MVKKSLRIKIIFCLLAAIEAIFSFTILGSIPMPLGMSATISGIPVIITSLILGPVYGAAMGFLFGLFSFIFWTFGNGAGSPMAFVFTPVYHEGLLQGNGWSLVICFAPRILTGVFPSLFYRKFKNENNKDRIRIIASIIGSLTNTCLVLIGMFFCFGSQMLLINNSVGVGSMALLIILGGILVMNGIPECIVCAIVCPIITKVLKLKK